MRYIIYIKSILIRHINFILSKKQLKKIEYSLLILITYFTFGCNQHNHLNMMNSLRNSLINNTKKENVIEEFIIKKRTLEKSFCIIKGYIKKHTKKSDNEIPNNILKFIELYTRGVSILFVVTADEIILYSENGFLLNKITGIKNIVSLLKTSPTCLISNSYNINNPIKLWDFNEDTISKIKEIKINKNKICPINKEFIVANNNSIKIFDNESSELKATFRTNSDKIITSICPIEESNRLIIGTDGGCIEIWDLNGVPDQIKRSNIHICGITKICKVGNKIISGDKRGHLKIWNLRNDFVVDTTLNAHKGEITDLITISESKEIIASSGKGLSSIEIWDLKNDDSISCKDSDLKINCSVSLVKLSDDIILAGLDDEQGTICYWNFNLVTNKSNLIKKITIGHPIKHVYYSEINDFTIGILNNRIKKSSYKKGRISYNKNYKNSQDFDYNSDDSDSSIDRELKVNDDNKYNKYKCCIIS